MRRCLAGILAILLIPALALAGKPSVLIQGKASVPATSDVLLDASGSVTDDAEGVLWAVEDDKGLVYGLATPPGSLPNAWLVLRNVKPGDYAITAIAFGTDETGKRVRTAKMHRLLVTGGPTPPPGPVPPPTPDPTPGPTPPPPPPPTPPKPSGPLFATFLYEEQDMSTATLQAKSTQAIRDELAKLSITWHAFDWDSSAAQKIFRGIKTPRPCLIITTADGTVVRDMPLPESPAKIIELARSLR